MFRRWSDRGRGSKLAALCTSTLLCACVTDHDFLKQRPDEAPPPDGGSAGTSPLADDASSADGRIDVVPADDDPPPEEPDGLRSLTMVHGIVDERGPIVFCLSRITDGMRQPATSDPFPEGGLRYGQRVVLPDGDRLDLESDGFLLHVIAGQLDRVAGLPCDEALAVARQIEAAATAPAAENDGGATGRDAAFSLDAEDGSLGDAAQGGADSGASVDSGRTMEAGVDAPRLDPPPLRVAALGTVPEGSLSAARSYLLAAVGCLGGPAFADPSERSICGDLYGPSRPTASPLLVSLSRRVDRGVVGLQTVNASLAFPSARFIARSDEAATIDRYDLSEGVVVGEISPVRPRQEYAALPIGVNGPEARVQVYVTGNDKPTFETTWQQARVAGGIDVLQDGKAYTIVLVGPHPSFTDGDWWNAPLLTLVANDPLAQ